MSIYSKILLAVDLNCDSIAVGRRARDLAARMGAELTVLHVVEYVPVEPVGENMIPPVQLLDELAAAARQRLVTLCADIGVDAEPSAGRGRQRQGRNRARGARHAVRSDRARAPASVTACPFL